MARAGEKVPTVKNKAAGNLAHNAQFLAGAEWTQIMSEDDVDASLFIFHVVFLICNQTLRFYEEMLVSVNQVRSSRHYSQ